MELGMFSHRLNELEIALNKIVEILGEHSFTLGILAGETRPTTPTSDPPTFNPDHEPNPVPGELSEAEADALKAGGGDTTA